MTLAIFDLDNTLLRGDSDYLWGCFIVERGLVEREAYEQANRQFHQDYEAGVLDIDAFLRFTLAPLSRFSIEQLHGWRQQFVDEMIRPIILPAACEQLDWHRRRGDTLLIITATNAFVTRPIAEALDVPHLLATEPERVGQRYTGRYVGTPTFRDGKVTALDQWLARYPHALDDSWFYSDSHNDLPLLERVARPVAVDPDPVLRRNAIERGWEIRSFRET